MTFVITTTTSQPRIPSKLLSEGVSLEKHDPIQSHLSLLGRSDGSENDSIEVGQGKCVGEKDAKSSTLETSAPPSHSSATSEAEALESSQQTQTESLADDDVEVKRLELSGDLKHVVGSQSILSQEILRPSQLEDDEDDDVVEKARSSLLTSGEDILHSLSSINAKDLSKVDSKGDSKSDPDAEEKKRKDSAASMLLLLPSSQPEADIQGQDSSLTAISSKCIDDDEEEVRSASSDCYSQSQSNHETLSQTTAHLSATAGFGSLLDAIQVVNETETLSQENAEALSLEATRILKRKLDNLPSKTQGDRPKRRRLPTRTKEKPEKCRPEKEKPEKAREENKNKEIEEVKKPATPTRKLTSKKRSKSPKAGGASKTRIAVAKYVFPRGKPEALKQRSIPEKQKTTPQSVNAHEAAALAAKIIHDPDLAKQLLLSMALSRTNPRTPPESVPGSGHVLVDGFFWSRYPPLESVLKRYMPEYYRLSIEKCQSCQQQAFNNRLVDEIQAAADTRGWSFDPKHFTDVKVLRDRIRCYYKTHIQNAKKRLKTMLRNPTKRSNAIHLKEHYDLIQEAAEKKSRGDLEEELPQWRELVAKDLADSLKG